MLARNEHIADRPMGRLVRLDGLRGVLAIYVTAGHMIPFLPLPPLAMRLAQALASHGLAAVELFFALSGLVIVQSLARFGGDRRRFLAARARRLLPVYLVVLAGAAVLMLAAGSPYGAMNWIAPHAPARAIWPAGPPPHPGLEVLAHLAFVHGALPHAALPDAPYALLGPAWSLSTEWQFYAAIAIFACGFDGSDRALVRLALSFVALAVLARLYASCVPLPWRFSRAFLPNEAVYFALGIAAARFWQGGRAGEGAGRFFAALLIVAMALGATHGAGWGRVAKALPPLGWAAAIAAQRFPASRPLRPLARALGARPILWLGLVSYPLYLVNEPLGRALALLLGPRLAGHPTLFGLLWGGATLIGSLLLAAILHYGIERSPPARRRRVTPPVAVPAAGEA
ncbi:MAG: acyltransferase [Acidiphilium sp. 20-67-58]|nr:MAG: acyltransferase [Acidiphilium sp. 20-67-58]